jgi:hypothetical protein
MDFGAHGNSELKTICEQLGKTEIMGSGAFLKSSLDQISQILTGEGLKPIQSSTNLNTKSSMNLSQIAQMRANS